MRITSNDTIIPMHVALARYHELDNLLSMRELSDDDFEELEMLRSVYDYTCNNPIPEQCFLMKMHGEKLRVLDIVDTSAGHYLVIDDTP